MPTYKVIYVLECDHVVPGPATITSNELTCFTCSQARRKIKALHMWEWHACCTECNFSRWCGLSQDVAVQGANRHYQKTMHEARVEYGQNPLAIKAAERIAKLGLLS